MKLSKIEGEFRACHPDSPWRSSIFLTLVHLFGLQILRTNQQKLYRIFSDCFIYVFPEITSFIQNRISHHTSYPNAISFRANQRVKSLSSGVAWLMNILFLINQSHINFKTL